MAEFFEGSKDIAHAEFTSENGKTMVACVVYERWVPIHQETIRCGATLECKLKRHLGVKVEEKRKFEEKLSATVGLKAIGNIQTAITEKSSISSVMEDYVEVERNLTYEAPRCGKYQIHLFQLARFVQVSGSTRRFLREPLEWTSSLSEHLNFYYDASDSSDYDVSCDSEEPKQKEQKGGHYLVDLGVLAFRAPYYHLEDGFKISFFSAEEHYPQQLVAGGEIQVDPSWLSPYQNECLGSPKSNLKATITPFHQLKKYVRDYGWGLSYIDMSQYFRRSGGNSRSSLFDLADD